MKRAKDRIQPAVVKRLVRACVSLRETADSLVRELDDGWHVAPYDPNEFLPIFSSLALRHGYRLASYQLVSGGNGNGFTFAIPADRELPQPPDHEFSLGWDKSGTALLLYDGSALPEWMHKDLAAFVEGDGTRLSYFEASLFAREIRELGAQWHGCWWSTHDFIMSQAAACRVMKKRDRDWEWKTEWPKDWRPSVVRDDDVSIVEFYTHSGMGQEAIFLHRDSFRSGLSFQTTTEIVATSGAGYIF